MKAPHIILCLSCLLASVLNSYAQEKERKYTLDGYLSFMNSNMFQKVSLPWSIDNQLHNRLNFSYYPGESTTINVQMRNRLVYGSSVSASNIYAEMLKRDQGVLDLSMNVFEEHSTILNSQIDRMNLLYQKGKWEVQLGRQRVNWGRTLVWNPNDIFNSYSFFDFDYEEKPGSDAFRVQYYLNYASSIELAASVNSNDKLSTALRYVFNKYNYDYQVILGQVAETDAVAGLGWAGNLKSIGFKGEATYFAAIEHRDSLDDVFTATLSLDYIFPNSFSLLGQFMYSTVSEDGPNINWTSIQNTELGAKSLAFDEWSLFAQASYPITPLLTASASMMYFPGVDGYFINPSLSYSLAENVNAGLFMQYFRGKEVLSYSSVVLDVQMYLFYLRVKWNF